jgi:hypothetical protein
MCNGQCQFNDNSIPPNEEEAHYYWTINEFQELIKTYGARKVFGDMGTDFIIKITRELS